MSNTKTVQEGMEIAYRLDAKTLLVSLSVDKDSLKITDKNGDSYDITVPYAMKTTRDYAGNVITDTYATKDELSAESDRVDAANEAQDARMDAMDAEEATHIHTKVTPEGAPYADYSNVSSSPITEADKLLPTHDDSNLVIGALNSIIASMAAYCTIGDANRKSIQNILDGTTPVASASSADKASKDGDGNQIKCLAYGTRMTLTYVQSTGVITAHLFNQNGTEISTADYNLPTELIFDDEGYDATRKVLWFHPTGNPSGDNIEIDVTDLFDVYTGGSTSTISVSVANNVVTATILDGSISFAKLDSAFQTTWNGWVAKQAEWAQNETDRENAEAERVLAENARVAAENAREASYLFYKDSEGRPCVELSNWPTH